jgi:hypothetical protein
MMPKQKMIIAIVAGVALLALLPVIAVIVIVVRHYQGDIKTNEIVPEPKEVILEPKDIIPESYWVIGPFGPGMDRSYEPEQRPDPARPCKTPAGEELKWAVKKVIANVKCLDFRKALNKKNTDNTAGYALVYVHSPKDQAGEMLLGSDDTITVWVNDVMIHEITKLRPGHQDEDKASMKWKQGWNTVLIKVGNATGDHLFFAKLRAATELRASTSKDGP